MRIPYQEIALLSLILFAKELFGNCSRSEGNEAGVVADSISNEDLIESGINTEKESFNFQAENAQLLRIIINSLYEKKEVALRELISNAADALEKARVLSRINQSSLSAENKLEIRVHIDKDHDTLVIRDTGVGMTKEDLIKNLGIIANSGTRKFVETLSKSKDASLIGQFGVGFYSAFLVAHTVIVTSKNDQDVQYVWESSANKSFTVSRDPKGNTLGRGTEIALRIKDDCREFLDQEKVKRYILKYTKFIDFPIYFRNEVTKKNDSKLPENDVEKSPSYVEEDDGNVYEWKLLNTQKPIWLRPKEEITKQDYLDFYKSISDQDKPLTYSHFEVEGEVNFKAIIYIPDVNYPPKRKSSETGIKIYSKQVLVKDISEKLLPRWLSFLKGIIVPDDIPLKIDREGFATSKALKVISGKVKSKLFELIQDIAKEDEEMKRKYYKQLESDISKGTSGNLTYPETLYDKFWKTFGKYIRVGCGEDGNRKEKFLSCYRFLTNKSGPNRTVSLEYFLETMPKHQKDIFYISNENYEAAMDSPYMEYYKANDYHVIILTDTLDDVCIDSFANYKKFSFLSIEKTNHVELDKKKKKYWNKVVKAFEPLTSLWKETLGKDVFSVRISHKLITDPVVVVNDAFGMSAYNDRVRRSQWFPVRDDGAPFIYARKHLEINPNNTLIRALLERVKENPKDPYLPVLMKTIYDSALLSAGFVLENPATLSRKIFSLIQADMGISKDPKTLEEYILPEEEDLDELKKKDSSNVNLEENSVDFGETEEDIDNIDEEKENTETETDVNVDEDASNIEGNEENNSQYEIQEDGSSVGEKNSFDDSEDTSERNNSKKEIRPNITHDEL